MQQGEDVNFLRFATALKILVGSSISDNGLERAKVLLQEYLLTFSKVCASLLERIFMGLMEPYQLYGMDEMKPNHHWAVHVADQVIDYGPLCSFWAFLTERLNKVLKNLNSNNWSGGLLEVSMMREFHRTAQLDGLLNRILEETSGSDVPLSLQLEHKFIKLLFGTGQNVETLGTIQDAAAHERTMCRVLPGSVAQRAALIEDDILRFGLVNYYNKDSPTVHLPLAKLQARSTTTVLGPSIETYHYALLDGRRIKSTTYSRGGSRKSSIIQVQFRGEAYVGVIQVIFRHDQPGIPASKDALLAFIRWLKRSDLTPLDDGKFIWSDFPELGVDTWQYNVYVHPNDPAVDCPPFVIPFSDIQCQAALGNIKFTDPPIWISTTMDRYLTSLAGYGMGDTTNE
ncbi:hypothetical protein B0H17DRAFT_1218508 [Mycena rosella]|uniref:Uncharacterized protein n=1 Tax=Mycena rosella TaxID=1033263 RepID=A0AAD7FM23_MYCRO|nr:hypothetical protein B0H17DRAFT_1218508 [Mycena rosella]